VNFITKKDKQTVIRAFSKQYKHARKKGKSELLTRLVLTTRYSRKHLMEILLNPLKIKKRKKRIQKSQYTQIIKSLRILWAVSNYACGKRLKPLIYSLIAALRRHNELIVSPENYFCKFHRQQLIDF
jgi:hypothetical protein